MDWKALVGTVAPWLAAAVGGPLGAFAVSTIGNALGLSEATEANIKSALAGVTPEQLQAIKQADQAFSVKMQELGYTSVKDLETIAAGDRDSARKREMVTLDWTPRILAYLIVGAFITVIFGVLFGRAAVDTVMTGMLVGYLSAKAEQITSYYFGSTAGSLAKTQLLADTTATAAAAVTTANANVPPLALVKK